MRIKIATGVGLALVVLTVLALLCGRMPPSQPPLRVGMTKSEVGSALGGKKVVGWRVSIAAADDEGLWRVLRATDGYHQGTDAFGNQRDVIVHFDDDQRLSRWEIEPRPRTRPPWLDRGLKALSW
jgi:hypothetical protein